MGADADRRAPCGSTPISTASTPPPPSIRSDGRRAIGGCRRRSSAEVALREWGPTRIAGHRAARHLSAPLRRLRRRASDLTVGARLAVADAEARLKWPCANGGRRGSPGTVRLDTYQHRFDASAAEHQI